MGLYIGEDDRLLFFHLLILYLFPWFGFINHDTLVVITNKVPLLLCRRCEIQQLMFVGILVYKASWPPK
jgi:hypothetical protein